jgi:hypothetical protein
MRVAILLLLLVFVGLLGWKEVRRRHARWERPQRVAIVLVETPGSEVSDELIASFSGEAGAVESALMHERRRYRADAPAPLDLEVFGPVEARRESPVPSGNGLLELLKFNLALFGYARELDSAVSLDADLFDVRIYLRVRESGGSREAAEGLGQHGGTIGVVSTEISHDGISFAWFVALHELFHTRGATDKYDVTGRALVPQGLAEPNQSPLFPQKATELMARGRPLSPSVEDIPGSPSTWVVGEWTAREIGWANE